MSLSLTAGTLALSPSLTTFFLGLGGVEPYSYDVLPGGAGGSINAVTGEYTAPQAMSDDPAKLFDTVRVTDSHTTVHATATARMMVGNPLFLLCDIIQHELGLNPGRVWVWDQKINEPTDSDIFVVVRVLQDKIFGVSSELNQTSGNVEQFVSVASSVQIHLKSRGPYARNRRMEIPMALGSAYAEAQQELNSFFIGRIPKSFVDLSGLDGSAVPYEFMFETTLQYAEKLQKTAPYFNVYQEPEIFTEP